MTRVDRLLGTLLAVCLLPASAWSADPAGLHHIELLAPAFDEHAILASCERVDELSICYSFFPRVDSRGRIAASGSATVDGFIAGVAVFGSFPAEFSGSIRGVVADELPPLSRLKLVVRARNATVNAGGVQRVARLSLSVAGPIDHAQLTFALTGKRKLDVAGVGKSKGAVRVSFENTAPLRTWDLRLAIDPLVRAKLSGIGVLSLMGDEFAPLRVHGSQSSRSGQATLSFALGADLRGASVKLAKVDLSGAVPVFELRFKLKGIRGTVTSSGGYAAWSVVPETFESEGTYGAPTDISAQLPYTGTVGPVESSYYVIRGIAPSQPYTLEVERIDGLTVVRPRSGAGYSCGHRTDDPRARVECPALSDALGELHFAVDRSVGNDAGGEFSVSFRAGAVLDEGSPNAPLDLVLPYRGHAATTSYYRVSGLVPGARYTLLLDDATADVILVVTESVSDGRYDVCSVKRPGEPCAFIADAGGEMLAFATVQGTEPGVEYTLTLASGGLANEGSMLAPLDLTGLLPHEGTALDGLASYYRVSGLVPDAAYTATLTGIAGRISFDLFGAGWHGVFPIPSCSLTNGLAETTLECVARADSAGSVVLRVRGEGPPTGVRYTVQLAAGGVPD